MTPHPDRDRPRFVSARRNDDGSLRWYWIPSATLAAAGWKMQRLPLDRAEAFRQALAFNDQVDQWYAAGRPSLAGAARRRMATVGSVQQLLDAYEASDNFARLGGKTRSDYAQYLAYLSAWIGDFPARAVSERVVKQRYEALAARTPRKAALLVSVGRNAWKASRWLFDRHHPCWIDAAHNPFSELGLGASTPAGDAVLWTRADLEDMREAALRLGWGSIDTYCRTVWWLGQREGDLLRLPRQIVNASTLMIRQGKTNRRVFLASSIVPELQAAFADELARQEARGWPAGTLLLLHDRTGAAWNEHTFRHRFADVRLEAAAGRLLSAIGASADDARRLKIRRALQIYTRRQVPRARVLLEGRCGQALAGELLDDVVRLAGMKAMWLRHTAITECAKAGLTPREIASISGHSEKTVMAILDRHYHVPDAEAAELAMGKRLAHRGGELVKLERKE